MRTRSVNVVRWWAAGILLAAALAAPPPGAARQGAPGGRPAPVLPGPPQSEDERALVVNADLVTFNVTVTDREGRHVGGLDRGAFTVLDDGVPQEISFFSDDDAPASVAVVFDTSASMKGDKITRALEALARLIETSHDRDEFFVIAFNSLAQLLVERTRDAEAVLKKFTYVQPRGDTALYDAVYLGVEKVGRGSHPKRVLVLISDGEDNASRYSFGELRRRLQESDVIVYAVGILGSYPVRARGLAGRETLKKLTRVTGGRAFFPEGKEEMAEAFERIALELRHRYAIGYRPANFALDGRWHRLKVKVGRRESGERLVVRSRAGYYAAANPR